MPSSSGIVERVTRVLGVPVGDARPLSGGDLASAWRVDTARGPVFAKTMDDAPPGTLRHEAAGLDWLRVAHGPAVPEVLGVDDGVLVLVWIEPGSVDRRSAEHFGVALATLHRHRCDAFGVTPPGGGTVGFLARNGVVDRPHERWGDFVAECRIGPLAVAADRSGVLPDGTRAALERVCDRLRDRDDDLAGPVEPPARLHGDLWGGNVVWGRDGRGRLVDPAAHGGHRETDLAMMRLFGGFPPAVFAAYAEAFPLAAGWQQRVELHQLVPLLVHACLFGGGYGVRVAEIAGRY